MTLSSELGPLEPLVGTWEGSEGLDVSHHHDVGEVVETPYREKMTFSPFGPVDNGTQCLYGLDYRTAAWRGDEEDPFHTEVGYWLWDADSGQVIRCFMVPRGVTILATGTADADSTEFTFEAKAGEASHGILSNDYLLGNAKTTDYSCWIRIGDDTFSYDETTVLDMVQYDQPFAHTDRNTLHRVP